MVKRSTILMVVLALCLLALVPAASAKVGGTDRPAKADLAGYVYWEPYAACAAHNEPGWATRTIATGTMSHLGEVQASWTHCWDEATDRYFEGSLMLTAANGDMLWGWYADVTDGDWPIHITGGTGRFEGATGTINLMWYGLNWDTDPIGWWAHLEGAISY